MNAAKKPLILLAPGDYLFSPEALTIATILGSCLSLTAWHPRLQVGGMCHYLLPEASNKTIADNDYRYGCNALRKLVDDMRSYASLQEYVLGLYGGSQFSAEACCPSIGEQNILFAKHWLQLNQLRLADQSIGGSMSRSLKFNLVNGEVLC